MIPNIVTQEVLNQLAAPNERVTVRVVVRRISNTAPYTVRGRRRRYVFRRDPELACHILDFPLSVWMQGFPDGPYRDNHSVAHDLQGNRSASKSPLVFLVLDHETGADGVPAVEPANESLQAFRGLLEAMEAPQLVLEAFDTLSSELPADQIEATIKETVRRITGDDAPEPDAEPIDPASITREGDFFYLHGEKIGKINAAGRLQMTKGMTEHRDAVLSLLQR